jgi:hypothetical protein
LLSYCTKTSDLRIDESGYIREQQGHPIRLGSEIETALQVVVTLNGELAKEGGGGGKGREKARGGKERRGRGREKKED